jgi:hypothetical protein
LYHSIVEAENENIVIFIVFFNIILTSFPHCLDGIPRINVFGCFAVSFNVAAQSRTQVNRMKMKIDEYQN